MNQSNVCPICNVCIIGDTVMFSHGDKGPKSRLWARVCRHSNGEGCINDWKGDDRHLSEVDRFGEVETHEDEVLAIMKQWFDLDENTLD